MNRQLLLVGGVGIGLVALLFFASRGQTTVVQGGDGDLLGGVVGAVAGLAGQVVDKVDWSKAGSNSSDAGKKVAAGLGLIGDPERKEKQKIAATNYQNMLMRNMEDFAGRVHQWLVRPDVVEWVLSSSGVKGAPTFDIYMLDAKGRRNPTPYRVEVPERAAGQRLAWAAEPIVRALGVFVQRGTRIGVPFTRFEVPAFSDNNPFAPQGYTLSAQRVAAAQWEKRHGGVTTVAGDAGRAAAQDQGGEEPRGEAA